MPRLYQRSAREQVPHLLFLRLQIILDVRVRLHFAGDALDHANAGSFERRHLVRIVGEQAAGAHAEGVQHLRGQLVAALVGGEAELYVRFYRIEPAVLQLVGLEFGHQANAAPFLLFVDEDAGAGGGDHGERHLELLPAIAPQRAEDVPRQALRVHAHQRRRGDESRVPDKPAFGLLGWKIAHDERDGGFATPLAIRLRTCVGRGLKTKDTELAPARGEVGLGYLARLVGWSHGLIIATCVAGTPRR